MKYIVLILLVVLVSCSNHSLTKRVHTTEASTPSALLSEASVSFDASADYESKSSSCPVGMIEVTGNYCPQVEQNCLEWDERVVNVNGRVRCLRFAPTKCLSKQRKRMSFCIDKYEYPNQAGAIPEVMITWNQMKAKCEAQGKRLCKDIEWEFACEGEEALPYPYGLNREPGICNIDKPWRAFDSGKLANPATRQAEVDRLSQRVPSGSMPGCVSPFGVHDMTGNVDESVVNSSGTPYKSGEKGGHWATGARNRCRPMTTVHNEDFAFYEIGGRCCANPK